jgi:RNA polymerase sigma factor (sigma-70 family)
MYSVAIRSTGSGAISSRTQQDPDENKAASDDDACFRAIRGFAGGSARAWMLSIVRNEAYSWLRKNRQAAVVTVDDLEAVEPTLAKPGDPGTETLEAALIAQTDAEHLRAAIAALPTPFRETLVLRDIEGLDYPEIAEATEVPIGTVMLRLARTRRRLE